MSDTELTHYGVKGMKWGVRRSPDQLRMKATKLEKKAAKQRIKALKYEKKWLKKQGSLVNTLYPGDSMYNGERYKHKAIRLNKKAAKNDLRAVKLTKKALKRSMQIKSSEVDQQTKERGRASIKSIFELDGPKPVVSTYKFSTSDASKAMHGKDKKEYDSIVKKVNSGKASEEDDIRMLELEEKYLEFG